MNTMLLKHVRTLVMSLAGLCLIALFAACAGVPTTTTTNANGTTTTSAQVTGTVQSVNASAGSATLNANGQQVTVSGLTAQQIATLQSQIGKTFTIQVTQTGTNAYNINSNTEPVENNENGTPVANTNNGTNTNTGINVPGSIDFIGKVQSINANTLVVTTPKGETLTMSLNTLTKRDENLNGGPSVGQQIQVKAMTNPDGSLLASKLALVKAEDQANTVKMNTVDYAGVTTSAVGSDNVIRFKVGSKSYNYSLNANTQVKEFLNAQAIGANQPVKVEVLFNGSNGTVTQIDNGNS